MSQLPRRLLNIYIERHQSNKSWVAGREFEQTLPILYTTLRMLALCLVHICEPANKHVLFVIVLLWISHRNSAQM